MGYIHAVLSIKYKINQIISGTFINIFATGMTSFLSSRFIQKVEYQHLNEPGLFPVIEIPGLYKIPFIGPILFGHNMYVYAMFIFVALLTFLLYKTRWGLRLRSVGEHPRAADTLGINVIKTRYMAVLLGGAMAGFAGTYFTLGSVGRFDEMMTAGRGFIGLAAMIFGNWNPIGSMGAGMLFGFFDSLSTKLSILRVPLPYEFIGMAPYLATMIVLAGVVGSSQMPAADGNPYEKESSLDSFLTNKKRLVVNNQPAFCLIVQISFQGIIPIFLNCIHHGQDVFRRNLVHDGMYGCDHVTTILAKNIDHPPHFSSDFIRCAERQHFLSIDRTAKNDIFAITWLSSPARSDMRPADVCMGFRISTPISMKSGIRSNTSPSVWKKTLALVRSLMKDMNSA